MTPFGQKLRDLRKERGITAKEMAKALQLSPPYLSALEHGHRGKPTTVLIHQICAYFGIIWDDAEELQRLADVSHPKVTIDTSGLSPEATRLANLLSKKVNKLNEEEIEKLLEIVENSK